MVAKGYHQKSKFDFSETFFPIVKHVIIQTVVSIVVTKNWQIFQLDVNNAFLHGNLREEIYTVQPPSYENGGSSTVYKLNKAIYGLNQAPRACFDHWGKFTLPP